MLSKASLDLVTNHIATNEALLRASIDVVIKGLTEENSSVFKVSARIIEADLARGNVDALKAFKNKLNQYRIKGFSAANIRRIIVETANSSVPSTKARPTYLKTPTTVLGMAWYLKREFLDVIIPSGYPLTDTLLSSKTVGAIKPDHLTRAVIGITERNIRYLSKVDREISKETPLSIILGVVPRVFKTEEEEARYRRVFDDSMYSFSHMGAFSIPAGCIESKEQFDALFQECLTNTKGAVIEALKEKGLANNGWYSTGHFLTTRMNTFITAASREIDIQGTAFTMHAATGNVNGILELQRKAILRKGIYASLNNVFTALLSIEDISSLGEKTVSKFISLIRTIYSSVITPEAKARDVKQLLIDFGQTNMLIRLLCEDEVKWDFVCSLSTSTYSGSHPSDLDSKYSEPNILKWSLSAYGLTKSLPNTYSLLKDPRITKVGVPALRSMFLMDTIDSTFRECVEEKKDTSVEITRMLEDAFTANELNEIYPMAKATLEYQERLMDIGYKVTLSILNMAIDTMLERRFGEE